MNITDLLSITVQRKASDLHLLSNHFPTIRINGELHNLTTLQILDPKNLEQMVFDLLNSSQKELLIANKEIDFSSMIKSDNLETRFRGNAYYQMGTIAASFRVIPSKINTIEELKLPPLFHEFSRLRQGFVIVSGASGQGKSTTLASIIAEINSTRNVHIVTIEDPIEHVYPKSKAIVSQREMYQDTHSWNNALKNILREDPDVVLIGEMRDHDTVASALTIAETGHLVFSTLHTNSSAQSIDRIIDIFPSGARDQIKMQLSMVLSAVITQRLVPTLTNERIPVTEILLGTPGVKNTIRDGKTHLLDNIIQTSKDMGMILFEDNLRQLVEQNIISHETALDYAFRPERYLQFIQK
jgi:twitching motility protein PilT